MIKNAQVARNDLVFQNSAGWDVNTVTVVGDNDNRSLETNVKNLESREIKILMLDLQDQLNLGYLETDVLAKGDIS